MTIPSHRLSPSDSIGAQDMPEVTLVFSRHRNDPSFLKVQLGDLKLGKVHESEIADMNLTNRTVYKGEEFEKIKLLITRRQVRHKSMALLARKPWSTSALSDRLKENSFDPQAVEMEMAYLSEEGWLDDQKSAGLILESLTEKNPTSRTLAEKKLKEKGFDEEAISTALDHYYAKVDLPEILKNMAIERRALLLKTHPDLSAQKQAQRIASQIERRGFDAESIQTAMSQAGFELEEPMSDA